MRSVVRWLPLAIFALLAGVFAYLNAGVGVRIHLGFTSLDAVPLSVAVFAAFLLGMAAMFLIGIRQDLRIRRALRESGFGEPSRRPPMDRSSARSPDRLEASR